MQRCMRCGVTALMRNKVALNVGLCVFPCRTMHNLRLALHKLRGAPGHGWWQLICL